MRIRSTMNTLAIAGLMTIVGVSAHAQATRTWISGVGDDANPGSRTAPCKTIAGAISKTQAGGEIDALDPGGFGPITITKSITLDGGPGLSSILASGVIGVVVNAGPADTVTIRNFSINGASNAGYTCPAGIRVLNCRQLIVENCKIFGVSGNAIEIASATTTHVFIKNTSITNCTVGLRCASSISNTTVALDNVSIQETSIAVDALSGLTQLTGCNIGQNTSCGLLAEGGKISAVKTMLCGNGTAARANNASEVRLSDDDIYDNLTDLIVAGTGLTVGKILSAGNNRSYNNTTTNAPTGSIPVK